MKSTGEKLARIIARRVVIYVLVGPILGEILAGAADCADVIDIASNG